MTLSTKTHLIALQQDALTAIRSDKTGPPVPLDHGGIVDALTQSDGALPPIYERSMREPLIGTFTRLGRDGWNRVLDSDPLLQHGARLGLDLIQSILQRADPDVTTATLALQEVISDLYDGYLGDADRAGVKPPDHTIIPPLVKWGQPRSGPYVWPATAASGYGCGTGVVNMPPAFASAGLAAWSALAHEGAGHTILHADIGLRDELKGAIARKIRGSKDAQLKAPKVRDALAEYWSSKTDEAASDVMAVLNMGPAAAVGMIAYLQALRADGKLLRYDTGSAHPADIARGFLVAAAIGLCEFDGAAAWRKLLIDEISRDIPKGGVMLDGTIYAADVVRDSAGLVARAVMNDRLTALEDHKITEIQTWTSEDDRIVQILAAQVFLGGKALPHTLHDGVYAAHGVAAAILVSLLDGRVQAHQTRMIEMLGTMHRSNVAWTGLEFLHSGALLPPHYAESLAAEPSLAVGPEATDRTRAALGQPNVDRMMAIALVFRDDTEKRSEEDDEPGSDGLIPFGFAARRHGLCAQDDVWENNPDQAEIPLHKDATPEMLALILGKPH